MIMYQNNPIIFDVQYHSSGHDGQVFDIHTHNQIEIIQTLSDSGNLLVNNSIYPIQTGSVYLINGLKPHCARPSLTKKYLRNKLFVNYDAFYQIVNLCGYKEILDAYNFDDSGSMQFNFISTQSSLMKIDNIFNDCNFLLNNNGLRSDLIKNIIDILTICFTKSKAPEKIELDDSENIVSNIINFIYDKIKMYEDVDLDTIANFFYIDKYYMSHLFKSKTGTSIIKYATSLKLAEAEKMLINTSLKTSEIAEILNYSSNSAFCKAFKKSKLISPTEFRKENKMNSFL